MPKNAIQILVSFPTAATARRMIRELLTARTIACAHLLGPMESHYRWQGKQERAREFLCLMKTTAAHFVKIEKIIRAKHPYQVPEILAFPVVAGHRPYLQWLEQETTGSRHRSGRG